MKKQVIRGSVVALLAASVLTGTPRAAHAWGFGPFDFSVQGLQNFYDNVMGAIENFFHPEDSWVSSTTGVHTSDNSFNGGGADNFSNDDQSQLDEYGRNMGY